MRIQNTEDQLKKTFADCRWISLRSLARAFDVSLKRVQSSVAGIERTKELKPKSLAVCVNQLRDCGLGVAGIAAALRVSRESVEKRLQPFRCKGCGGMIVTSYCRYCAVVSRKTEACRKNVG